MDGFEVCRTIRKADATQDIPVVFLTAKIEKEDIIRGFKVGAVDYVTKPFNSEELIARVRTHLELKTSRALLQKQNAELGKKNRQLRRLNEKLEKALKDIETLEGILPICTNCKKIRKRDTDPDISDNWMALENYLLEHTKAAASHSLCPDCSRKLYPEFFNDD